MSNWKECCIRTIGAFLIFSKGLFVIACAGIFIMSSIFFYNTNFAAIAQANQQIIQSNQQIEKMNQGINSLVADLQALKDAKVDAVLAKYRVQPKQ